jgi:putative hydrolase of the HAD superfamily
MKITTLIFDWGDTIMRDLKLQGPMKDWDQVEWVTGAKEMLEITNPKFTCCIATSASHSNTSEMIIALKRVGANAYFQHFLSSADLRYSKPDPEFFKGITKALGTDPWECISIGNLYEKDITPAKQAGLTTIWFNENREKGNFPDADHIINEWKELPAILGL